MPGVRLRLAHSPHDGKGRRRRTSRGSRSCPRARPDPTPPERSPRPAAGSGRPITYSTDIVDLCRRAAVHIYKILKGAKPGDPIEQPSKFELATNLRAAKILGLPIRQTLLARADRVIDT